MLAVKRRSLHPSLKAKLSERRVRSARGPAYLSLLPLPVCFRSLGFGCDGSLLKSFSLQRGICIGQFHSFLRVDTHEGENSLAQTSPNKAF